MRELRSISFEEREAIVAVLDLLRKMRQPLPPGQVLSMELLSNPVRANLLIVDDFGERRLVPRSAAELAASLINYCIERRIRLPTKALKFVDVIGGRLNLLIYIDNVQPSAAKKGVARRPSTGRSGAAA